MATATEHKAEWIDATEAARILDANPRAVERLAAAGRIGRRDLPLKARFRRADVERLARETVHAASS